MAGPRVVTELACPVLLFVSRFYLVLCISIL